MQLFDTHVHINFDSYKDDREEMMQRAYDAGVTRMVHSCCNVEEISELMNYCKEYNGNGKPDLYMSVGVHPTDISSWTTDSIAKMQAFVDTPNSKIKAIGETGLDYYHEKSPEGHVKQQEIFKDHIELAKQNKLPLIIHTRDAWEDTLKIIEAEFPEDINAKAGVLHCYTGDLNFARSCVERGFYVSWSGVVTFNSTQNLRDVAKEIPLNRTLIETDCPFLAPQKKRGKRNEPGYVSYVAEVLADCYGISVEELAEATTQNAMDLFGI